MHGEIQKVMVTSVVRRPFCIVPSASRACADFCDPTAVFGFKGRGNGIVGGIPLLGEVC